MTATYAEVKTALGLALQAIPGLNVHKVLPGSITPPAAVIAPGTGAFLTYRSSQTSRDLDLAVTVFVQQGETLSMDDELSRFISDAGDRSVYAAVEADPTLGGVIDSAVVTTAQDWGVYTFGGVPYLGCVFAVEVLL